MSWTNMLSPWQWAILAAVPPAIVMLYFLKLKRQPLEVPSTFLWHKSIEDLRVNSIWQRLRQSLLLLLQLLLIALAMFALARPSWKGSELVGERFVFLVDNSASMAASDVSPSRLDEAKRRIGELIDQMGSGDVAMIISFADSARTEQGFTDNRRELRRRLDAIAQTNRSTSLAQALPLAAGLANPGRSAFEANDQPVAEGLKATMYIFSDGRFSDVAGFTLGNLTPIYVPIGQDNSANLAITAFSAQRPQNKPDQLQAFVRLENFGAADLTTTVELYLDDAQVDAKEVTVKAHASEGVAFDQPNVHEGAFKVTISSGGDLASDDQAWVPISEPRHVKVLLVTPGDDALQLALEANADELADITTVQPDFLESKDYQEQSNARKFDLVIFDQCQPKEMPQASTLFVGRLPPLPTWSGGEKSAAPQVIDINGSHPLTQLIDLGNVKFVEGTPLKPPMGATVLIESNVGVLMAIAPRDGFEDAVLGVEIEGSNAEGRYRNTDWPLRLSFPVFTMNVLKYFSGSQEEASLGSVPPGRTVVLKSVSQGDRITVRTPAGKQVEVERGKLNAFPFSATERPGVYEVEEAKKVSQRFAVNLFDSAESDIRPRLLLNLGAVEVKGQTTWEGARREAWKLLVLAALAVLMLEWYIYNRRVYI